MRRIIVPGVLATMLSAFTLLPHNDPVAQAQQTQAVPQRYQVVVVQVKPDMLTEWQALQRNETIPALQKIGATHRDAWQTIFGEGFEYAFVTPIAKFADRDNPQGPFIRALGEQGAANYNARYRKMIASQQTYAIQPLPELGIPPSPSSKMNIAVLTAWTIAPGRTLEYEAWVKGELLPAYRKLPQPALTYSRTIFGGNADEYISVRYIDNFAEIDQGPALVRALGAEGAAKMMAKTAGLVLRTERRVIRYVPELSFRAKTTS